MFKKRRVRYSLPEGWRWGLSDETLVGDRETLLELVDVVAARARFLLEGEETAGHRRHYYATGFFNLAACRRQWRRPLADWRPHSRDRRSEFSSLCNHLLAEYPVPAFLAMAWLRSDDDGPACRDLFLHIGRGNNPRTGKTPVPLTRRMAHHFLRAPDHYSIEGALRWGQILALGGSPQLVDACVSTRLGEHFGNDAFWLSVLGWFIAHPTFDLDQVGPVVDFIRNVKFEGQWIRPCSGAEPEFTPSPQPGFSMARRTPDALLRQMERWHARLHVDRTAARAPIETWPSCGIRGLRRETTTRRVNYGVDH